MITLDGWKLKITFVTSSSCCKCHSPPPWDSCRVVLPSWLAATSESGASSSTSSLSAVSFPFQLLFPCRHRMNNGMTVCFRSRGSDEQRRRLYFTWQQACPPLFPSCCWPKLSPPLFWVASSANDLSLAISRAESPFLFSDWLERQIGIRWEIKSWDFPFLLFIVLVYS